MIIIMLLKNLNCLCITKKIQLSDSLISSLCEHCASYSLKCFMMKDHFKCNKCTYCDHLCVDVCYNHISLKQTDHIKDT